MNYSQKHKPINPDEGYASLKRYAIGSVIERNVVNKLDIEVFLTEIKSNVKVIYEDTNETIDPTKQTGLLGIVKDKNDNTLTSNTQRGAKITATWLKGSGNRMTPPNVNIGETVEIYKPGDSDIYYWRTLFNEPNLRDREMALFAYSNVDREKDPKVLLDKDNSYFYIISPLTKEIRLHTSMNDDEPLTWDIHINTKEGFLEIFNSAGDKIHMKEEAITCTTKTFTVDAETINMNGSKEVNITSKNTNIKGGKLNVDSTSSFNKPTSFNSTTSFNAKASINAMASVGYHSVVN